MHAPIDALSPPSRMNKDTLDPPKLSVSPIAPLISNEQLSHRRYCIDLVVLPQVRDEALASFWLLNDGLDTLP